MSLLQRLVLVTTIGCLGSIGTASAQVSESHTGTTDQTTSAGADTALAFEASGGFAGILDRLLILPDGRVRASTLLLGTSEVRWSRLAASEVAALQQAVASLFPVPGKHGSGSGDMRWTIRRMADGRHQQFSTTDPTGHGRHVIQAMVELHQSVLMRGTREDQRGRVVGLAGPAVSVVGDTIQIAIVNDTRHAVTLPSPCPFQVRDSMGRVVFAPICPAVLVRVRPGETHRMTWDQVDDRGQTLPAGTYFVEFTTLGLPTVTIRTLEGSISGSMP